MQHGNSLRRKDNREYWFNWHQNVHSPKRMMCTWLYAVISLYSRSTGTPYLHYLTCRSDVQTCKLTNAESLFTQTSDNEKHQLLKQFSVIFILTDCNVYAIIFAQWCGVSKMVQTKPLTHQWNIMLHKHAEINLVISGKYNLVRWWFDYH